MKPWILLLIFLALPAPAKAEETASAAQKPKPEATRKAPGFRVEQIRGEVWLYRRGKISRLQGENSLQNGDLIRTGANAGARLVHPSSRSTLDLSSFTTVAVESARFSLKYGAVLGNLPNGKSTLELRLPHASVHATSKASSFLASVMRSQKEFNERLAGRLREPPFVKDFARLHSLEALHVQVSLLEGVLKLKPRSAPEVPLSKPGDLLEIHGSQADFAPRSVQLQELKAAREAFNFPSQTP
jgi:hypothetical protein